ncbi:MAG: metal-dependent hydrolase [Candidatus Njordarchaeia archaeon]
MKGVVHYFVAAAIVSLLPFVMELSVEQKSLIIVLGAIAGLLPDYIDFKIAKFFERVDEEILPDWPYPDSQKIARKIAMMIDESWNTKKTLNLQLHTIKVGPNLWRKWYVTFDSERKKVKVMVGPITTTGGKDFPETINDIPEELRKGEADFNAPLFYRYKDNVIKMRAFTGPMIAFKPTEDYLEVEFLPWHRRWSHSITIAAVFSMILWVLSYILTLDINITNIITLAFFVGYNTHIITDQPGYMGSNLFWPITKKRIRGFKIAESMDPFMNFFTFYLAIMILLWQMNTAITPHPIDFALKFGSLVIPSIISFIILWVMLPEAVILLLRKRYWKPPKDPFLEELFKDEEEAILT